MKIVVDDLSGPEIALLLEEHLRDMHSASPPESVFALDLVGLKNPAITFWSVWDDDGSLIGCGALRDLGSGHGELKSMRTVSHKRKSGVATRLLKYIVDEARNRGFTRISLETGSQAFFDAARRFYERFGFVPGERFGTYPDDPNSVYMHMSI